MQFIYQRRYSTQYKRYDKKDQERIRNAVLNLPDGDVVRLQGKQTTPPSDRLRIGKYRILFRMDAHIIYLDVLDSRGDVYKE